MSVKDRDSEIARRWSTTDRIVAAIRNGKHKYSEELGGGIKEWKQDLNLIYKPTTIDRENYFTKSVALDIKFEILKPSKIPYQTFSERDEEIADKLKVTKDSVKRIREGRHRYSEIIGGGLENWLLIKKMEKEMRFRQ